MTRALMATLFALTLAAPCEAGSLKEQPMSWSGGTDTLIVSMHSPEFVWYGTAWITTVFLPRALAPADAPTAWAMDFAAVNKIGRRTIVPCRVTLAGAYWIVTVPAPFKLLWIWWPHFGRPDQRDKFFYIQAAR